MLNKKPIFVIAFTRGGSNILVNLIRSHPDVCSPRRETQQVFKGKPEEPVSVKLDKAKNYLPIKVLQKEDIFSPSMWTDRKPVAPLIKTFVDRTLYYEKMKATSIFHNYYKFEDVRYQKSEIKDSRLICKNVDGLIFLTGLFAEMYPDATFIALVRNGLAVCEGHIRRGKNPAEIAHKYNLGCQRMIEDSNRIQNYHIIRFEDIFENPQTSLEKIYAWAGLDLNQVEKIRLETKAATRSDGTRAHVKGAAQKTLAWYPKDEFQSHFVAGVNDNQINRLSEDDKKTILAHAGETLRHFSYV